jgi:iron-sulfur cluster assembly protein
MITVTAQAQEEIKKFLLSDPNSETAFLRFNVKIGGCSGYSYDFQIDTTIKEKDFIVFESDDLKIVVNEWLFPLINNSTIDFKKTLTEAGLVVNNPNAKHSCGCGQSFSADA